LVGSHVVQHLGARGHKLVAMTRPSSDTSLLRRKIRENDLDVSFVTADLVDRPELAQYMQGCDVVVHTAARIDPHGEPDVLRTINVEGTRLVLEAAIAAGVKHFVYISSLSVIMGDKDCYAITESEPLRPCKEAYANSKIEAEKIVMHAKARGNTRVTALRPGFIYGPNETSWLPKLIYNMKAGTAMLVGDGSKETNLIYVENLCRAIDLAMMNPVAFGEIYNLTDGEHVTKQQLLEEIAVRLAIAKVRIRISLPMARLLVNLSSALALCAPPRLKSRLALFSRPALRLVGLNQGFDISKAERELGYTDRIPFAVGMKKTLESFAEQSIDQEHSGRVRELSQHRI
jgi:nucleoside-diphosphate-sugar epimerase